ncbi:hypothetical protein LRX75_09700 [Rhizobium sp. DKSPLA3]|uniref:Uncharacterized protein n=1 Tax=Rhizobium quercicola TaxID=2901226 RepID=A0A9X1NSQ6_9HYPH|nr:hypothetical protein [Rhizobium quercicola]MCD7109321.1 hypothetical protein [Rhizobium quercicola]
MQLPLLLRRVNHVEVRNETKLLVQNLASVPAPRHGPRNVLDVLATQIMKQIGSYEQARYAIPGTPTGRQARRPVSAAGQGGMMDVSRIRLTGCSTCSS